MNSSIYERHPNRFRVTPHFSGYTGEGPSLSAQHSRPFDIERDPRQAVTPTMFGFGGEFQIFNFIVFFVLVFMMDFFTRAKFSAQMLFHHVSMHVHAFAIDIYSTIAGSIQRSIFARLIISTQDRAKESLVSFFLMLAHIMPRTLKCLLARNATECSHWGHGAILTNLRGSV